MLFGKKRAENGTRTRDPNLGKVVLYQLSYFRKKSKEKCEEEETRTPTSQLTLPPQSSASTNSATSPTCNYMLKKRVPRTGLEPARLAAHAPETCASTNSATWAFNIRPNAEMPLFVQNVERKTGLGPATPTLARLCSTN